VNSGLQRHEVRRRGACAACTRRSVWAAGIVLRLMVGDGGSRSDGRDRLLIIQTGCAAVKLVRAAGAPHP